MRSIIEEASSISKAIEKGWLKAGKPKDFSVKIFEEPEKNFFGITIKSAKIGIFFNNQSEENKLSNIKNPKNLKVKEPIKKQDINVNLSSENKDKQKKVKNVWSKHMINKISLWLNQILDNLNLENYKFSILEDNFSLKVQFDKNIYSDIEREKKFFTNLSVIIMQMLKKYYRRPFKGYKILFRSN